MVFSNKLGQDILTGRGTHLNSCRSKLVPCSPWSESELWFLSPLSLRWTFFCVSPPPCCSLGLLGVPPICPSTTPTSPPPSPPPSSTMTTTSRRPSLSRHQPRRPVTTLLLSLNTPFPSQPHFPPPPTGAPRAPLLFPKCPPLIPSSGPIPPLLPDLSPLPPRIPQPFSLHSLPLFLNLWPSAPLPPPPSPPAR